MNLLEAKEITQTEIDYINELTIKGMKVKEIVERELGKGATAVEVEGVFQAFNALLKQSNYTLNREKNIYELKKRANKKSSKKTDEDGSKKEEVNKIKSPSVQKKSNEKTENFELKNEPENEAETVDCNDVQAPTVQQESSNDDNEKDNKKRARQKPTKSNPLGIATPLDIAEIVCESAGKKEDRVGTGVYVMQPIAEDFAKLEEALYYLPGYALVDVALIMASQNMGMLEKSKVFKRFTEIVREDKVAAKEARNKEDKQNKSNQGDNNQQGENGNKENEKKKNRKKQTNIKLCKESTEAINKLSHHFAFLNKSEIINLSVYALSQSVQASFMKKEDVKNEK